MGINFIIPPNSHLFVSSKIDKDDIASLVTAKLVALT